MCRAVAPKHGAEKHSGLDLISIEWQSWNFKPGLSTSSATLGLKGGRAPTLSVMARWMV
jgi:hypothetical protein